MDIRQAVRFEMDATGVDVATADVKAFGDANAKAAEQAQVFVRQTTAQEQSLTRVGSRLEAYTRSLDPVAKALANAERGERLLAAAHAQGMQVSDANVRAVEAARRKYEDLSKAQNDNAKSAALSRNEWVNLGRQFQDVGTMAAMGMSPMQILTSQGAQIADVFASSRGGAGAALSEFGMVALRIATHPLTLLAAGIGVASLATMEFAERQHDLERALNGVGRAAGVDADTLRQIALRGAAAGGLSAGEGVSLAASFAGAGISGRNIGTLVQDALPFSRAFGLDMEKAQTEIAQIVGESGLGAFEKRFGAASFAERELVHSLEASGRFIDAQTEKTRLFDEAVKKARDSSSELSKIWEKIKNWATTPVLGIGAAINSQINGPSLREQLAAARGEYLYLNTQRRGQESYYPGEAAAEARVRDLERRLEEERQRTERAARDLDLNRRSQIAGGVIDELNPDSAKLRGLTERREALRAFVDSEEALGKLGDRAGAARGAFDRLSSQIANFETSLERIAADSALASQQAQAYSFSERASVAAEKALLDARRAGMTEIEQAASIEAARNQLIAEGNRRAADYLRSGQDQHELLGLTGLPRRLKEIELEARGLREQYLPGKGGDSLSIPFANAGSAATRLADALNGAAAKISGAAPTFTGGGPGYDPRGLSDYIRTRAAAYGIDPNIAMRVARSEGLGAFTGDAGSSYGAFQLHRGGIARGGNAVGGLGDDFFRDTGLDPSHPANERATIDYALRWAAKHGWRVFHGARRAGIGDFEGTGGGGVPSLVSTAGQDISAGEAQRRADAIKEFQDAPLRDAERSIDELNRRTEMQAQSFGKSAGEVAMLNERMRLYNEYARQNIEVTPELSAKIDEMARKAGVAANASDELAKRQHAVTQALDDVRSLAASGMDTFINDLTSGKKASDALRDSLLQVASQVERIAMQGLLNGLFGEQGKAGGGLFGGLLANLFGGGGASAPMQLPGAALAGGGLLGWLGRLWPFADGGMVTMAHLPSYAGGGALAPGGGFPIIAHPGEIILNRAQQKNVASGMVPKMTFIDQSSGVTVTPRMSDGEIVLLIENRIASNNKHQSEAARRSA